MMLLICKLLLMSVYTWIVCSSVTAEGASSSSLWGSKVSFSSHPCRWRMSDGGVIPALRELSVCVDLMRSFSTSDWTAFVYKAPGKQHVELGLAGNAGNLLVSLFGEEWTVAYDLPLHHWHTVCLTWSSHTGHFHLIVNETSLKLHVNESLFRPLTPNGTLTLGVSHSFVGGVIDYETGRNFLGDVSLFRLWGEELSLLQLMERKCVDGSVVTWRAQDWVFEACPPSLDHQLKCVWSIYRIGMSTSITQNAMGDLSEHDFQRIALSWLRHIFPQHIRVQSLSVSNLRFQLSGSLNEQNHVDLKGNRQTPNKTLWFDCVVFVSVSPGADVRKAEEKIHTLLLPQYNYNGNFILKTQSTTIDIRSVGVLPNLNTSTTNAPVFPQTTRLDTNRTTAKFHTSYQLTTPSRETVICPFTSNFIIDREFGDIFYKVRLNLTMKGSISDPKRIFQQWLRETLGKCRLEVINLAWRAGVKFSSTFQIQASTPANVTETGMLIYELLTKGFSNSTITISVPADEVNITLIDPGYCPEEILLTVYGIYVWPSMTAQSTYTMGCVKGRESASRFCKLNGATDKAEWEQPDMSRCLRTVADFSELENITVTPDNSEEVVNMIDELLDDQNSLSDAQMDIVLEKLSAVTTVATLTTHLSGSITNVVSEICNFTINFTQFTNEILNITDHVGDRTQFSGADHNMTASSLALQLVNADTSQFQGLSFGVSSFQSGFTPQIFLDRNFTEHPDIETVAFISLPAAIEDFFLKNKTRIQFHFYGKENLFEDYTSSWSLNSYVVSASVTNATVNNLKTPVVVSFRHLHHKEDQDVIKCVYWDFHQNNGNGGWNDNGCQTVESNATHTSCSCDHLTHFGVLLDISKTPINPEDEMILTIISYLGSGISAIFLGVTLLTYLSFEKLRRDYPSKILINLSVALLGLNMLYMVNSWLASFNNLGLCITVAAFLHYFFLATFTWMGLGAINMYFALVKVFNTYVPSYILKFCAVGWGLPLLIVSLVLAVDRHSYGSARYTSLLQDSFEFCWLKTDVTFYVTVVSFVVLIMACNVCVFAVVLIQIHKMRVNKSSSSRKGLLHDVRVVGSLTFLLGLTWILAFFAWGEAKTPLMYLFSVLNSLQGFFIFLFYCLMKDNVRKQWRIHLCCRRFRGADNSNWSRSATQETKAKGAPQVSLNRSMKSESTSERKC